MKGLVKYTFLLFLLGMFSSCEDFFDNVSEVEIEEHEPKIVVYGYLDEEYDQQSVNVGLSAGYLDGEPSKYVDNAILKLFKNGIEQEAFYYGYQEYVLPNPLNAEPGDEFRLEVEVPDIGKVQAVTRATPEFNVLSIERKGEGYSLDKEEFLPEYEVIIQDNPDEENYYGIEIFKLDTIELFTLQSMRLVSNDPDIHKWYIEGLVFNDVSFNGLEKKIQVLVEDRTEGLEENEAYLFIIKSITPELYQYARSYTNFRYNLNNPFAEPVTVFSNIDEDGYGIFSYIRNQRFYINE